MQIQRIIDTIKTKSKFSDKYFDYSISNIKFQFMYMWYPDEVPKGRQRAI